MVHGTGGLAVLFRGRCNRIRHYSIDVADKIQARSMIDHAITGCGRIDCPASFIHGHDLVIDRGVALAGQHWSDAVGLRETLYRKYNNCRPTQYLTGGH